MTRPFLGCFFSPGNGLGMMLAGDVLLATIIHSLAEPHPQTRSVWVRFVLVGYNDRAARACILYTCVRTHF